MSFWGGVVGGFIGAKLAGGKNGGYINRIPCPGGVDPVSMTIFCGILVFIVLVCYGFYDFCLKIDHSIFIRRHLGVFDKCIRRDLGVQPYGTALVGEYVDDMYFCQIVDCYYKDLKGRPHRIRALRRAEWYHNVVDSDAARMVNVSYLDYVVSRNHVPDDGTNCDAGAWQPSGESFNAIDEKFEKDNTEEYKKCYRDEGRGAIIWFAVDGDVDKYNWTTSNIGFILENEVGRSNAVPQAY